MRVVTFDSESNFIKAGRAEYFVLWTAPSRAQLVPSACPHRGGPLHLATPDAAGGRLVCPWHEMKTPVNKVRQSSVPFIRSGDRLTAVLDEGPEAPIAIARTTVKANLVPCQLGRALKATPPAADEPGPCPAAAMAIRLAAEAGDERVAA
jgi:nitrite reductase/ring-hydroxylating ferredoxin subunit